MSPARARSRLTPFATALTAALAVTAWAAAPARPAAQTGAAPPHLMVLVVIDQFRADYVDWYGAQWTKGLRRLFDTGAVFANNAYPYAATLTCAGHATIGTGAFPAVHGMSGNDFYDRALRRTVPCAADADAVSVPFAGATGRERHGPRSLLAPTFAEELRRQAAAPPRIVVLGQKPRTAITLAGQGGAGTIVLWLEDDGTWASSTAYTKAPWADADDYIRAHPLKDAYGQVWNRALPLDAYRFEDDAVGEATPAPWGRTFPHPLISRSGQPDREFVTAWVRSPWDDAFLTDLAIHLLRTQRMGLGPGTDFLAVSFPSTDHIGHEFGPRSHEVQDALARADANVGRLLDAIEAQVGGDYVIGVTSDHGVSLIPEQVVAGGGDGGRLSTAALRSAVNAAVERALGLPGPHVASIYEEQVALTPGTYELLRLKPGGLQAVVAAMRGVNGVASAYAADDLLGERPAGDPSIRAWQLSYVAGRSGDFALTPKPNWFVRPTSGTTHGSLNPYDQRVPLVLAGSGIRPGRYTSASSSADLVVSFAALAGIQMPRAQGRPLTEAIVR